MANPNMVIRANYVDIDNRSIFPAIVGVSGKKIVSVEKTDAAVSGFMLPGFIDAHVHIESSLLVPSEFARMAVVHGTVATISDPHEIANVCGMEGIRFMLDNAADVPFYFYFGVPSCVPATGFETAGAEITVDDIRQLLADTRIRYLAEMMNFPGVLHEDAHVLEKIRVAVDADKKIDGHAPGLKGTDAAKYFGTGISTDHECFQLDEALDKLALGVRVLIREGSAARNFDTLIPTIGRYPDQIMFCSDDKHPDSLAVGHIDQLVQRALTAGYDLFDVIKAACINPVRHYGLDVGLMRVDDNADFIIVEDLKGFQVSQTYIKGQLVADRGKSLIPRHAVSSINHFNIGQIEAHELTHQPEGATAVIECLDGQLITNYLKVAAEDCIPANDILKIVVINRYFKAPPAVSYVKNFGLQRGALASTVAHDSHNIIAVGVDDHSLTRAINGVIGSKGGLSAYDGRELRLLPLPVAGLMSDRDAWTVSEAYTDIDTFAKNRLGSSLKAPFMSLSFMALPVIPHLKMTDKGLFDVDRFEFVS